MQSSLNLYYSLKPKLIIFNLVSGIIEGIGCILLNDIVKYFNHDDFLMYMDCFDAEKCFDTIWHDALSYKLWEKVYVNKWLLLHRWYFI